MKLYKSQSIFDLSMESPNLLLTITSSNPNAPSDFLKSEMIVCNCFCLDIPKIPSSHIIPAISGVVTTAPLR